MEPFENEDLQQPEAVSEEPAQEPVTEQTQSAPVEEAAPCPTEAEQSQSGYYHGIGVGQREAPFASTPYATYHPYQNYQPPYQTYQTPPQPPKEKKHYGKKIFTGFAAIIVAVALVVLASGVTAGFTSMYWNAKYNTMMQYLDEKVAALQDQIEEMGEPTGPSGGELVTPGDSLTAGQIYSQNVNSVVALTCTLSGNTASSGTGFVLTENGYIVTNHHVIDGATAITVTMANGQSYKAALVGSDATNDVALIKISAEGLETVIIGRSSDMKVGDQVVAIGNALGELTASLTVGYISGIDRDVTTDGTVLNMIQTDVAINSGNSGGPLFNARGEVIGITTAKYSGTTSSGASIEGISFAVPIDDAMEILYDLQKYGYVKSGYLGIYASNVDAATAEYYGFPVGVYVAEVVPGLCAQKAGMQAKDIIVELGGYEIGNMSDLSRALRKFEPGDTITVKVWRSGQELLLTVTLDARPQG